MKSVSPIAAGFDEITFAKNQSDYIPLPAHRSKDDYGVVTTRWQPTFWERIKLLFGVDIYLQQITFNKKLQPVKQHVGLPEEFRK